jgi:O-antigen ligase
VHFYYNVHLPGFSHNWFQNRKSLNSQIVSIQHALRSKNAFLIFTSFIPVSLFLKPGFAAVSAIWFFALCYYNRRNTVAASLQNNYLLALPIILFVLKAGWIIFSDDKELAGELILRMGYLLIIPLGFLITEDRLTEGDRNKILAVFVICCFVTSLVCVFNSLSKTIEFHSLLVSSPSGGINFLLHSQLTESVDIDPVYFSMFCALSTACILKSALVKSLKGRLLVASYFLFFILMLNVSVGIISGFLIFLFTVKRKMLSILVIVPVVVVFSLSLITNLGGTRDALFSTSKPNNSDSGGAIVNDLSTKLAIWTLSVETIKEGNVLGYGTGDGQIALEKMYKAKGFQRGITYSLNSHNEFLSTFLDLGLSGAFLLVAILFLPLISGIHNKNILLTCFSIIIILFFCTETVLVRQKGIVFFTFFYCLFSYKYSKTRSQNP